jgi:hypothetical protein
MLTGGKCDRLMFESTYSPGLMAHCETACIDEVGVEVSAEAAAPKPLEHRYDVGDAALWMEMEADVTIPTRAQVATSATITVRIVHVGQSQEDNDYAEDFHILLRERDSGREIRLDLEPAVVLGAPGPSGEGRRPPATLRATWTPDRPGHYVPYLGFTYTDAGHVRGHHHLARLDRGSICRTHVGTLLFAQHMQARSIFLGYETRRAGWQNVAELGLAEMAAFGGGGGFAASEAAQAKYREFFKGHPELFDGWQPTAPAAVLFAFWGSNPLAHTRPVGRPTLHDQLAATQRLFVALLDATLPDDAARLGGFRAIYLQAREYDLAQQHLAALRDYADGGGRIVLLDEEITINGRPAAEQLGAGPRPARDRGSVTVWDPDHPAWFIRPLLAAEGTQKNLRFALYRKDQSLALHAVNYNVCLLDEDKPVTELKDVNLEIPLPEGWIAVSATSFDPDAEPEPLDCTAERGRVRLTVPSVHLYKIILLKRR